MIGITLGDVNGVGPEILLRAFREGMLKEKFVVFGDRSALQKCDEKLGLGTRLHVMAEPSGFRPGAVNIYDSGLLDAEEITPGRISEKVGAAALQYMKKATLLALQGEIQSIVTLPVNKEAIRLTEPDFSGHTGYIADLCGTTNYTMMLVSDKLIVTHVSTHVSLREALERVKTSRILDVIRLTHDAVVKLRPQARIAVAGLNPHAGENGAFGSEEIDEIMPAVERARKEEGLDVSGPVAPDTVFHNAVNGNYEAVVCMFHDQGHIPLKLLDFDGGVNVTLGLPFTRTSVDHGTAYDIAGKGIASLTSFRNAFNLALELSA